MNGKKTIISKELRRVFQDKKLIFSLFILPAIIVIGMYSLMGVMVSSMQKDIEEHTSKVYIQNAPMGIESHIEASGFKNTAEIIYLNSTDSTDDIKNEILDGTVDLLAVFDKDFLDKTSEYKKAGDPIPAVNLHYNTSGNYSAVAKSNFETMVLSSIQTVLLAERLGNLEILTVFETKQTVIVDEDKQNGEFLAMLLPYLITFMLFVGAMSLGVDAITGEKERGTMASMLLAPIKRQDIVIGKLISLAILSSISAAVYAVSMIAAMPMMADGMGEMQFSVSFSVSQIIMLVVIMMVMVYLYVSLVSVAAVIAKTAKEAQTYVSPIYMIVLVAGMITMFQGGIEKPLYLYGIPVYGNALAIQNLMTNELTLQQFGLSVGGTLLVACIFTMLLTKAFNSEKIMFNA